MNIIGDEIKCFNCKIAVYGSRGKDRNMPGVGKSRLINRWLDNQYEFEYVETPYKVTVDNIEEDRMHQRLYKCKKEEVKGNNCMIDFMLYDTSG